jgi:hypothetical protein
MFKKILMANRGARALARGTAHMRPRMCSGHHNAEGVAAAEAKAHSTRSVRGD